MDNPLESDTAESSTETPTWDATHWNGIPAWALMAGLSSMVWGVIALVQILSDFDDAETSISEALDSTDGVSIRNYVKVSHVGTGALLPLLGGFILICIAAVLAEMRKRN